MRNIKLHFRHYVLAACFVMLFGWFLIDGNTSFTASEGMLENVPDSYWDLGRSGDGIQFPLASSTHWLALRTEIIKDRKLLENVEVKTGVKARLLVAEMIAEQMRIYFSARGNTERILHLKDIIVNSNTGVSIGPMGIKLDTAISVENNLRDESSPSYLGKKYETILDFRSDDKNKERYDRITNKKDHYYAYLYGALYNAQLIRQWRREGYDISGRPEILATLYNIGFKNSHPKSNPKVGGGIIIDNGVSSVSFGRLVYEFYYSDELLEVFSR